MARWVLEGFGGIRPRVSARLLKDAEATVADGCRVENGELGGWNNPLATVSLARPGTNISIWHMSTIDRWLHWTTDVDVAKSPVAGDTAERTYYTGDGVPKVTSNALADVGGNQQYPESWYPLAVAIPSTAPVVTSATFANDGVVSGGFSAAQAQVHFYNTNFGANMEVHNTSGPQAFTVDGFVKGLYLKVSQVLTANEFTVTSNTGGEAVCDAQPLTGWTVSGSELPVTGVLQLPNDITVIQTAHNLKAGDVLRVTNVTTPPTVTLQRLALDSSPGGYFTGAKLVTPTNYGTGATEQFIVAGAFDYSVDRTGTDLIGRSYVYTYVTDLAEESAPSLPSDPVTIYSTDSVSLGSLANPPADGRTYSEKRIYRSLTGSGDTAFEFVASISAAATTYVDTKTDAELGEVLYTEAFDPPPSNLSGIVSFPGGILAGFFANVVCFSEPSFPHAWPTDYRLTTDYPIVGLGVFGNSILVVTEGMPYVIVGVHPRAMSMRRIDVMQACVSKRSIQSVGDMVLYASPDGLVSASASGFSVVTRPYLRKEDWDKYYPTTIIGAVYDNRYYGFYYTGTERKCFIFDPSENGIGLYDATVDARGTFYDPLTDKLYISSGSAVQEWDGGTPGTYTWRSRELRAAYAVNLGAARVQADGYPVTFTLIDADTNGIVAKRSVIDREPFRLPAGHLYNRFYVEVSAASDKHVQRIVCSETMPEMQDE